MTMRTRPLATLAGFVLILAACGGGDGDAGDLGEDVFGGIGAASGDSASDDGQGSSGGAEVGPVAQTAESGIAWVEVDGKRIEYRAFDSVHYECTLSSDEIRLNYQTREGDNLSFNARPLDGDWIGSMSFAEADVEANVAYGFTLGSEAGTLGIGDQAMSYEGTVSRVEDFDVQNAQETEATIAVNCAAPGGDPTAEIGDQTFMFLLSGASGLQCEVSDGNVSVRLDRSNPERQNLQLEARNEGDKVLGHVVVESGETSYTSTMPDDGTGLTVAGASVTYEGTFASASGEEVEGSVSVSCG